MKVIIQRTACMFYKLHPAQPMTPPFANAPFIGKHN